MEPSPTPPLPPLWRRAGPRTFAVPFGTVLALCLSTMGTRVSWQDSGFYLSAIHDLAALYPHGFVLYELSCWAWTRLFFFLDFTRAVHLYSAVCAASAAGVLALATRDWLRSRGSFRVADADETAASASGILAGCLAGSGYTFWASGIAAKGYALYFLILALLLWRMIVAVERLRPADFTGVAALIGLSWAAHPSAALAGGGFLAFVLFAGRGLGRRGILGRTLLAALAAAGPTLLVPLLALRDAESAMGHPTTARELLEYYLGGRFTGEPDAFGYDPVRAATLQLYFWEEFLVVGVVLVAAGLVRLARANPKLLAGIALWTVPYVVVTILFRIEGQQDFWFVAAWMPLYPVLGAGAHALASRARARARWALAAAGLAGVGGAAWANFGSLDQRRYEWAETYGRLFLRNLEPGAVLLVTTDDVGAICRYLQRVRGERRDVTLVGLQHLGASAWGGSVWYEEMLRRHHPDLRFPAWPSSLVSQGDRVWDAVLKEFLAANVGCGRPLYFHVPLARDYWPEGWEPVPAGPVWRMERAGAGRPDPKHWDFPIEAERIHALFRRPRGIVVRRAGGSIDVAFEPYERRILTALIMSRQYLADWHLRHGRFEPALKLYESILLLDPLWMRQQTILHRLGTCALALGREAQAEEMFRAVLEHSPNPDLRAGALMGLGDLERKRGREDGARARYREAAAVPGLAPEVRRQAEERQKPKAP